MTVIGIPLSPMLTRRPLITALALGFGGLASAAASATTLDVTSCADNGAGSLRQIVHDAISLDIVNLSQLTCSQISLTTGAIAITQGSLTIVGPGADKLSIDGTGSPTLYHNVFSHTGLGTLEIDDLTMTHGAATGPTCGFSHAGGCICSSGNLTLKRSAVKNCKVTGGPGDGVRGGGISAQGNILLDHSTVSGNQLLAQGFPYHFGGGVFGSGNIDVRYSAVTGNYAQGSGGGISNPSGYGIQETILSITHSTVSGNTVSGTTNIFRGGGGISFDGRVVRIDNSIISDNRTPGFNPSAGGGIFANYAPSLTFSHSTISGNYAFGYAAIAARYSQDILIADSTISGNISVANLPAIGKTGSLVIVNSTIAFNKPTGLDGSLQPVELESSIIADGLVLSGSVSRVTGANNLIPFSSGSGTLSGTITACPMLGPLADNGGSTPTHALLRASPAIDAGNNFLGFANDQREGFARVYGISADIGAFEWQGAADDAVFRSGFEPLDACGQ